MKPAWMAFSFVFYLLFNQMVHARPLVRSDVDEVYATGTGGSANALKVELEPGLYHVGDVGDYFSKRYYLLADTYANDPQKILAVLIPEEGYERGEPCTMSFYQGRPIKGGTVLMLSPLGVDESGNLRVLSEMRTDAPVIEISRREPGHRFPYQLRGRNGALAGEILGMRGAKSRHPHLRTSPSNGIFASGWASGGRERLKVTVSNRQIAFYDGTLGDQSFELVPINGEQGKFAALTRSTLDTMGEAELSDEQIKRLATFITDAWDDEVLLVARPSEVFGEFRVQMYKNAGRGLLEWVFGQGRLTPVTP